jgi:hypothetical protein
MAQPKLPTATAQASARLSDRLKDLAALKADRERVTIEAKLMERDYRRLEGEVIEAMLAEGVHSVKLTGIGTFTISARNWLKVADAASFLEWASQAELVRDVVIHPEADQVTVTFDITRPTSNGDAPEDEDEPAGSVTLTNGLVRVEVVKKLLGEHVKELTANGQAHPPGIEPAVTTSITLRRS